MAWRGVKIGVAAGIQKADAFAIGLEAGILGADPFVVRTIEIDQGLAGRWRRFGKGWAAGRATGSQQPAEGRAVAAAISIPA